MWLYVFSVWGFAVVSWWYLQGGIPHAPHLSIFALRESSKRKKIQNFAFFGLQREPPECSSLLPLFHPSLDFFNVGTYFHFFHGSTHLCFSLCYGCLGLLFRGSGWVLASGRGFSGWKQLVFFLVESLILIWW